MALKRRNWILQKKSSKDPDDVTLENLIRRDALLECGTFTCTDDSAHYGTEYIPVGDISFVEAWLMKNYQKRMVPIEVPEVLRTREFLGRRYQFLGRDKLSNHDNGKYFVKNVSRLKEFNSSAYEGRIPYPSTLPEGIYLLSDWLDIYSEFRVFVHHDQVLAVQNYLGSPLVFPDAGKILKMVEQYQLDRKRPAAYTMDIAVIQNKQQLVETVILEIHPFVSCGLYGFADLEIPDMLEEGVAYYVSST